MSHTIFHTHLSSTKPCHPQLCHTPSLSHTIFHTHLCHTPSSTHIFVRHNLSHTSLSHTILHAQLCHTPAFSRSFATHHLPHTSLLHTILHTPLSHRTLHIQPFNSSILHHLLCLSFFPRPAETFCFCFLEEVDLWGYPVLDSSTNACSLLQDSRKALVDLHEWLLTTVRPTEKVITFDEFALTIYDVVNSAIQDFLRSDAGQSISDAMQVKLRFFRSDWLRQALIVMRVAQFFSKEDGSRKEANTMEVLVALRRLRRQWQYHNAMYSLAANSPEPGSKHAKETSAQKPWHKGVKTLLTDEQVLQAAVLTETKPEEKFSKTNLRSKFRNYRGSAFKEDKDGNTLYRKLGIALDKLVANGLLLSFEEVQGEDDEKKRQTKNPKKTTMYTKPKASEMTEESQKSRNDLHVTVEAFPA